MQTSTHYGYNLPESSDPADISKISYNFNKIDTDLYEVAQMVSMAFDRLSMQPGNRTTDTLTTQDNLDTWTSVITDAGGHEVARKVDVESKSGEYDRWTSTITIGDKVVTIVDTETANGWAREVR